MSQLEKEFTTNGYTVLRNLLPAEEVVFYREKLEELSRGGRRSWTFPDGVNQNRDFWPLIFYPALLDTVRDLLDPNLCYLQHNDLHAGFSSMSWHRDNVNRTYGVGSDWDETQYPYQIVRVGIYLQRYEESHSRLGFIRGSHRINANLGKILTRRRNLLTSFISFLCHTDRLSGYADWVATQPGDCVIFDPRILHSGSRISGLKYAMFLAFGVENVHFYNHYSYYRHLRHDLDYKPTSPELAAKLQAADLYPTMPNPDCKIQNAWIPTKPHTMISRLYRQGG